MKVRGLPNFLARATTESAHEDGTAWVKQRSEEAAKR